MTANVPASSGAPHRATGPDPDSLIRADGPALGRGALQTLPELEELLTAGQGAAETDGDEQTLIDRLRVRLADREQTSARRIQLGFAGLDRIAVFALSRGVRVLVTAEGDDPSLVRYVALSNVEHIKASVDHETRRLAPQALADAVRGRKNVMVCLSAPFTSPLQTPITRAHIKAVTEANPDAVILIEATNRQFGDQFHLARLADEFDQVIYQQTGASDLFLPGARLAWSVASARHAGAVAQTLWPRPPCLATVRRAILLLDRPDLLEALRCEQILARDHLITGLSRLGLTMINGLGPWVLLKWQGNARGLVETLHARFGIVVQHCALPPLDARWIRISATVVHEAEQVVWALSILASERAAD